MSSLPGNPTVSAQPVDPIPAQAAPAKAKAGMFKAKPTSNGAAETPAATAEA